MAPGLGSTAVLGGSAEARDKSVNCGVGVSLSAEMAVSGLLLVGIISGLWNFYSLKKINPMITSNIIRSRKVTRITPPNLEEVARSQARIIEFLSNNPNKDNTRLCAPSSPDAKKTSNLSPQVEKVSLLNESVSEAEGTAKMVWSIVKPSTTPTSPVEPQNPSNFSEVACKSKVKRGGGNQIKPLRHLSYPYII